MTTKSTDQSQLCQ